ncbi:hypothetical protein ACEN9X_09030 [Mucilaginibacter sp. Mucisp86]|uniref:hypothetical protein n=1 Tax=Mucilaginibacter sp. Mucisp86 TaxID=3243060 RepID=UPI0039B56913
MRTKININMDINELEAKVLKGMNIAIRKLVETSAEKGKSLIIGEIDGSFKVVPAKELLKTLPAK